MAEQEPSPDSLTVFLMRPCGCQIVVEIIDWDWRRWKWKQGRKRGGGRRKCWARTLSLLLRPTSPVPRAVPSMHIHDESLLYRWTEQGEGFCCFPGQSLSEITPSIYLGSDLENADGPSSHCLLVLINFSDSQILRSQLLNLGLYVDFNGARTSYKLYGDMDTFLESGTLESLGSLRCQDHLLFGS